MEEVEVEDDISAALALCISHPFEVEYFAYLHSLLGWGRLSQRKRNERLGIVDLAMDWLRDKNLTSMMFRDCLWDWLQAFVIIDDLDDEAELEPIRSFVARGGIELAAAELDDPECPFPGTLLSVVSWCCMDPAFIPRVMSTGIHHIAIGFITEDPEQEAAEIAMSFLRALTGGSEAVRDCLLADGLMDCVRVYLRDLNAPFNDIRLRRAFRASSIITRMASRDKTGRGKRMLLRHPRIIMLTIEVFDRVLDVGPTGTVMNMSIDPHLITMDLLLLAPDEEYRQHFKNVIPVLLKALERRGEKNLLMTKEILGIFLHLTKDPAHLGEMQKQPVRTRLIEALQRILRRNDTLYSEQTVIKASQLLKSVDISEFFHASPSPSPPPEPGPKMTSSSASKLEFIRVLDETTDVSDAENNMSSVVISSDADADDEDDNDEEGDDFVVRSADSGMSVIRVVPLDLMERDEPANDDDVVLLNGHSEAEDSEGLLKVADAPTSNSMQLSSSPKPVQSKASSITSEALNNLTSPRLAIGIAIALISVSVLAFRRHF